jgi:NADH:ubiquinone oxidoreductase subunit 4 (subunit M)
MIVLQHRLLVVLLLLFFEITVVFIQILSCWCNRRDLYHSANKIPLLEQFIWSLFMHCAILYFSLSSGKFSFDEESLDDERPVGLTFIECNHFQDIVVSDFL